MAFLKLYEELIADDYINTKEQNVTRPRILIFTEGTILGPKHWWEWNNDKGYIPIGQSIHKINAWKIQGAKIAYLTSRRKSADVMAIREILRISQFPGSYLFYRAGKEHYNDIAEQVIPDILIEDDCRSIGGRWQMTITYVKDEVKQTIHSIVVREFAGIDNLPDDLHKLLSWDMAA